MITLTKMTWSNWYSYGEDNTIFFNKEPVSQILGKNGSGKTSIPLILQEVLYNKNYKGIKKADIANRNIKNCQILAELYFKKDNDKYKIELKRKSTLSLNFYKNGIDISKHTATGTYKLIEQIIGIDFKLFLQLTYQSSKDSLHFLTSTDSQRKAFLIALFNLDKYVKIYEVFKERYKSLQKAINTLEGSCNTIHNWIEKYENMDFTKKELQPLEEVPEEKVKELHNLELKLKNINALNNKINQNLTYKRMLKNLDISILNEEIELPEDISKYISRRDIIKSEIKNNNTLIKKLESLNSPTCPTCYQEIDIANKNRIIQENKEKIEDLKKQLVVEEENILKCKKIKERFDKYKNTSSEFEKLTSLIDNSLSDEILDEQKLIGNIKLMKNILRDIKTRNDIITKSNLEIKEHNSKIDVIKKQLEEYNIQLDEKLKELDKLEEELVAVDILRKSFSSAGIVNYKIDFLVKDLELEINKYLTEFSDGRFQLYFKLSGEKLNIEIIDNNKPTSITSLSSGQLTRVNVSTLLAIRKLLSNISNTKINVLFMDEIMGVLDMDGRDKLIEVLLNERELNTFLVSHGYTHPLLDKINVVCEDNISKIEYG